MSIHLVGQTHLPKLLVDEPAYNRVVEYLCLNKKSYILTDDLHAAYWIANYGMDDLDAAYQRLLADWEDHDEEDYRAYVAEHTNDPTVVERLAFDGCVRVRHIAQERVWCTDRTRAMSLLMGDECSRCTS